MSNGFLRPAERPGFQNGSLKRRRTLLTFGHSYVVALNRRLAHELSRASQETWEVTVAAPQWFHGRDGLGPHQLLLCTTRGSYNMKARKEMEKGP
jgi:hypothetical protein